MNPVSIGSNTHATKAAHHGHDGHGTKTHGSQGKKGSPFASSLEGALADDDAAAKLEGESAEEDKKKTALGAGPPPQPSDLAAALAFAAQAKTADATAPAPDAEGTLAAKIDPKLAGKVTAGPDLQTAAGASVGAQDDAPLKTLAATKNFATMDPTDAAMAAKAGEAGKGDPTEVAQTVAVELPAVPGATAPTPAPTPTVDANAKPAPVAAQAPAIPATTLPTAAPAAVVEATAKPVAKPQAPAVKTSSRSEDTERAAATKPSASTTATEASPSAPAKVFEAQPSRQATDANDPQAANTADGRGADRSGNGKPTMTLAKADKKARLERAQDNDMSADAARVTATVADSSFSAPVGLPTDTAKTVTAAPLNAADAAKGAETTIRSLNEVSPKMDEAIKGAEAAGHKRTLASGEARGQLVTEELGRVEVVAHALDGAHESGRVEVHVRAVEEHAKQVIAANAESLREHVRVEVPNATVHVQKPSNDLLGNGTTARDFSQQSAGNASREGNGRDGRGDASSGGARDATVKNTALPVKGARVRFVL